MTEKPRVFEADAYNVTKLEFKARPAKDAGQFPVVQEGAGLKQVRGAPRAYALSRDVILRLIDWLQNE